MRFIPTRVRGAIDYPWAVALAAMPWVLGFGSTRAEKDDTPRKDSTIT